MKQLTTLRAEDGNTWLIETATDKRLGYIHDEALAQEICDACNALPKSETESDVYMLGSNERVVLLAMRNFIEETGKLPSIVDLQEATTINNNTVILTAYENLKRKGCITADGDRSFVITLRGDAICKAIAEQKDKDNDNHTS